MDTREHQVEQPGVQKDMKMQPSSTMNTHKGSGKLERKVCAPPPVLFDESEQLLDSSGMH